MQGLLHPLRGAGVAIQEGRHGEGLELRNALAAALASSAHIFGEHLSEPD